MQKDMTEEVEQTMTRVAELLDQDEVTFEGGAKALVALVAEGFEGTEQQWVEFCIGVRNIVEANRERMPDHEDLN